jgi:uncharacterized membrane protein HdeD (DUF308 family)
LILIAGLAYGLVALYARGSGTFIWRFLAAVTFLFAGTYLTLHPTIVLENLTLPIAIAFFIEGIAELASFGPSGATVDPDGSLQTPQ